MVFHVVLSMFLVMAVGWVARRRNYLNDETTATLGKFVIDITFPALVFTQMINTVDAESLRHGFVSVAMGLVVLALSMGVGFLLSKAVRQPSKRATFIFLISIPNWIFLPLPIVTNLYGDDGVRTLLLLNISAQVILWTVGVGILQEKWDIRRLFVNPGNIATMAGILCALLWPESKTWFQQSSAKIVFNGLTLVGSLTVPLSLIITGAQLGSLKFGEHRPDRNVFMIMAARLILVPVILVGVLSFVGRWIDPMIRDITCLVAAMPVAVSCGLFVERYGGDTELSARAICYSTLVGILTIPVVFGLIRLFSPSF